MKKFAMTLLILLASSGSIYAATAMPMAISTQELVGVCSDQSTPEPQIYCDVYGQGVYDGYLVTRHPNRAPEFICVSQPAPSRREVMNQFMMWSKANPQYNMAPAADSLLRFLAVKFVCSSSAMSPTNAVNKIIR